MVELQPSKLVVRVRFPSPALVVDRCSSAGSLRFRGHTGRKGSDDRARQDPAVRRDQRQALRRHPEGGLLLPQHLGRRAGAGADVGLAGGQVQGHGGHRVPPGGRRGAAGVARGVPGYRLPFRVSGVGIRAGVGVRQDPHDLRPLRRPAGRPHRPVALAALRAGGAGRAHLCPRRLRAPRGHPGSAAEHPGSTNGTPSHRSATPLLCGGTPRHRSGTSHKHVRMPRHRGETPECPRRKAAISAKRRPSHRRGSRTLRYDAFL